MKKYMVKLFLLSGSMASFLYGGYIREKDFNLSIPGEYRLKAVEAAFQNAENAFYDLKQLSLSPNQNWLRSQMEKNLLTEHEFIRSVIDPYQEWVLIPGELSFIPFLNFIDRLNRSVVTSVVFDSIYSLIDIESDKFQPDMAAAYQALSTLDNRLSDLRNALVAYYQEYPNRTDLTNYYLQHPELIYDFDSYNAHINYTDSEAELSADLNYDAHFIPELNSYYNLHPQIQRRD